MPVVGSAVLHKSTTQVGRDRVRRHKVTYLVKTDDPTDTSALIVTNATIGLPVQYVTKHPHDATAIAVECDSCERDAADPNTWYATYSFDNATLDRNSSNDGDPADFEPIFDWSTETRTRLITKDIDGKTILNAAGDPREPIEIEDDLPVLVYERPEITISFGWIYQMNNSVNSDNFYGAAPGTLRVKVTPKLMFRNLQRYWMVKYCFRYRPEGWQPKPLEAGLRQLVDSSEEVTPPTDPPTFVKVKVACTETGNAVYDSDPVTSPVALDEDGKQIPPADLHADPTLAVYTEIKGYRALAYASLGL